MKTVTRQALTDCVNPQELKNDKLSKDFNQFYAALWLGIVKNDTIRVTDALKAQLHTMFADWPKTLKAVKLLLGA